MNPEGISHREGPPDPKRVVVLAPTEVPEGGKKQKSDQGGTSVETVENAAGWVLYEKRTHSQGEGDERRVVSSRQHFNSFDMSGRTRERLTQTLPDHPKGESQTRETYEYSTEDSKKPSVVRGRVEAGPDTGHEWERTIQSFPVVRDGVTLGSIDIETTVFLEQGANPTKPGKGMNTRVIKYFNPERQWLGERTINERGEQSEQGPTLPPNGEWEDLIKDQYYNS